MTLGARLGIDVGKARVGVARCDSARILEVPVETVARDHAGTSDLDRIAVIALEYHVVDIVVGLPISLSGEETPSTRDAREFASRLADAVHSEGISVRLVDERLSTVSAQAQLHSAGRNTKTSRQIIDQAAAVLILQHANTADKNSGSPGGTLVEVRR